MSVWGDPVRIGGGGAGNIQPLVVTQNGTYAAGGGVSGYSPVMVSVSGGGGNYCRIRYYDLAGTYLLAECVEYGQNALWGAGGHWSHTPGGPIDPQILTNITADADIYAATFPLYGFGTEYVPWILGGQPGSVKNADSISIYANGGSFVSYAMTDVAVDITGYEEIVIHYIWEGVEYTDILDISGYAGSYYISVRYLTDSSHNEGNVGLSSTKAPAGTFQLKRSTYVTRSFALKQIYLL